MKNKQSSQISYLVLGATPFIASALIFYILVSSDLFDLDNIETFPFLLVGFIYGVSLFAIIALLYNWREAPERAKVQQSHQILTIAKETATYLRQGLSSEAVERVAEIILDSADVDAVAISDNKKIMAYAGLGSEENKIGKPLWDSNVQASFRDDDLSIYNIKKQSEISGSSRVWTGVSIALKIQTRTIGRLDFLYRSPMKITESHITIARGLGNLLSTELELSELDKQRGLAFQAELKALRAQINPHFLFNILNTIAALCRTNPQTARELLLKFSDFFRDSLERQSQFTTLDEEIKYVDSYLALEQARFGTKLQVKRYIDAAAKNVQIPSLVIQPLVENAIKHGMAASGELKLSLTARLTDEDLVISVKDDGVGMKESILPTVSHSHKGLGIGLSNVKERLLTHYGSNNRLAIDSTLGYGTEVTLRIPLSGGVDEN